MPKTFRIILLAASGTICLLVLVTFIAVHLKPTVSDLEKQIAGFDPPTTWKLAENRETGRGVFCIDVDCPSIARRWEVTQLPSPESLKRMASEAGWSKITIDEGCKPLPTSNKSDCSIHAKSKDNFPIGLSASGPWTSRHVYWVNLSVQDD